MRTKTMHVAHETRSAEEFLSFLATTELTIGSILRDVAMNDVNATVMVVGSIPKGFARPESDIDLLVMLDRDEQVRRTSDSIVFYNGSDRRFMSHKFDSGGMEFGVEVCSLEGLSGLIASVDLLLNALSQPKHMGALPVLPYDDIRFLDMVRNGWVLHNPAFASAVKDRLRCKLLPLYCSSFNYIQYLEALEDCYSLREQAGEVFATNVRICAHRAALSLLALRGITDPNERWTWKYLNKLEDAKLLQLLSVLIFPRFDSSAEERLASLRQLRQLGQIVEHALGSEPTLAAVVAELRMKLAYVFDERTLKATQ